MNADDTHALRELRAVMACVEVVLYGDVCEDENTPCEDDECNACRSAARVDAYFRPASGPIQTYTLRPFDVREHTNGAKTYMLRRGGGGEHMWDDNEPEQCLDCRGLLTLYDAATRTISDCFCVEDGS